MTPDAQALDHRAPSMPHHTPSDGSTPASGSTRRSFLGTVSTTALATSLSGALGTLLAAAPAEAASRPFGTEALTALLAFTVPGDDAYSRQQGVSTDRPGAASAGLTRALATTLDEAPNIAIPGIDVTLPGGAAISTWVDLSALPFLPAGGRRPFASAFANLSWDRKARVLKAMETNPAYRNTPLCWVANQLPLLAAFVAFGEAAERVGRTGELRGRPVGWEITGWHGIQAGAPERRGYYRGRTAVSG